MARHRSPRGAPSCRERPIVSSSVAGAIEEVGLDEIVSFTVLQNERSRRVMERIGLVRDPAGDFDHPKVDATAYPWLVRHVFYRLSRDAWSRLPEPD